MWSCCKLETEVRCDKAFSEDGYPEEEVHSLLAMTGKKIGREQSQFIGFESAV